MRRLGILSVISFISVVPVKSQTTDLESYRQNVAEDMAERKADYEAFRVAAIKDFDDFRKKANEDYARFMDREWEKFKAFKAKPFPERPEPPEPCVKKGSTPPETVQLRAGKTIEPKDTAARKIELVEFKLTPESVGQTDSQSRPFAFDFYDTPCRTLKVPLFSMAEASEKEARDAWLFMDGNGYTSLADDCMRLREKLMLNDWGYIGLLETMTAAMFGRNSNEAVVAQMFLLVQSGYKARIARTQDKMVLMVPFTDETYSYPYVEIQNESYYIMDKNMDATMFSVFNMAYPDEQTASVQLCRQPLFNIRTAGNRALQSDAYPDMHISIATNKNLVDFLKDYPRTNVWPIYVKASISDDMKRQLYPQLRKAIAGKSKTEAVQMLLNFVQTAFEYKTDQEQFGEEMPLFADEMLYYPYADCEDRSILLSVLVKDLTGLDVILLDYPEHIAMAVRFDEPVDGYYFTVDGEEYVVCDPTYIGASVGDCMPRYVGASADVIKID